MVAMVLFSVVFQSVAAFLSFRFVVRRRLGKPWILVSIALLTMAGLRMYFLTSSYSGMDQVAGDPPIESIELSVSFLLGVGFVLTERWYLLKERLEGRFRLIAEVDQALIGVLDEKKILSVVCEGLVRDQGYKTAWIGVANLDGSVSVAESSGEGRGFLSGVTLRWDDTPEGNCPPGVAIRTGETCVANRVMADPRTGPWRGAAGEYGIRSFASVRVDVQNSSPMVLSLAAGREGVFDGLEMQAIKAMANRVGTALFSARRHELFASAKNAYRDLLKSQRDGVILMRGGVIVRANPAGSRLLGYASPDELVGKDPATLFPESADSDRVSHLIRPEVIERESIVITRMQRKDGSQFEGEAAATWLPRSGRTEGWERPMTGPLGMLIFRDVTLRAQTLEELRKERDFSARVLDMAGMLVLQVSPEGEILLFNRQCEEVTGYAAAEAIGREMTDLLLPESGRDVHLRGQAAILSGRNPAAREYAILAKSAEERLVVWNYEAIPGPDGKVSSILMTGTDVTERRRLERAILGMQKMEAVGTLAGGIAHDFNNILTGILGNLDLAIKVLPPDSAAVTTIEESILASERAARLIQQLLEFSRRTPLERRATDMRKVVREALRLLSQTIDRRIGMSVSAADDLWLAEVDSTQVHQVVMNLCVNARDAILEKLESGKEELQETDGMVVRVSVDNATIGEEYCRLYPFARPGEYVVLAIEDNGAGMDEATQRRIFEPFFTTKGLGRGTGLGLSTVYGIVKQHEGWITLESVPGVGTTFRCYLPRSTDSPEEFPAVPERKSPLNGSETILLVDDEEMIRDLGTKILTMEGYTVITAGDGREAVDVFLAERGSIDLVLLDLTMPRMSGLEVLERIRKVDPEVKVVLSSGYRAEAMHDPERFSAASAFLSKPYRVDVLARTIRDVLDGVPS